MNKITQLINDSMEVKQGLLLQTDLIQNITETIIGAISKGNKLLICGNGGSAADAQHIAAELVGKFLKDRVALPAIALNANTSILTSLGNDYSYDIVFARQVEALAKPGDVVAGISTSGNSPNIIQAMNTARKYGCKTIGFTGKSGGKLADRVDLCFHVPSNSTPRIQESHILVWHIICELIEEAFSNESTIERKDLKAQLPVLN
jgi:D-sedoheptulose 7-phosphate isomerase